MPKFRAAAPQRDPRRSSLRADKVISWAPSLPWAASLPLTSLSQWQLSVLARHHQFHRCRRLAPRPALEMFQLNEGASAQRTILRVQSVRSESSGIHGRSPSRGASYHVVCEALLSASPAPREIRRNRIGACGLCRTSSLEISQSPILAVLVEHSPLQFYQWISSNPFPYTPIRAFTTSRGTEMCNQYTKCCLTRLCLHARNYAV
jgi:hypothetical protein